MSEGQAGDRARKDEVDDIDNREEVRQYRFTTSLGGQASVLARDRAAQSG